MTTPPRSTETAPPRLLTLGDVADGCQVSERTVQRWIKAGDLRAIRLGRHVRIHPKDFERFLKHNIR